MLLFSWSLSSRQQSWVLSLTDVLPLLTESRLTKSWITWYANSFTKPSLSNSCSSALWLLSCGSIAALRLKTALSSGLRGDSFLLSGGAGPSPLLPPEGVSAAVWLPFFAPESHLIPFRGLSLNNREFGYFAFHSVIRVVFVFLDELINSLQGSGLVHHDHDHHQLLVVVVAENRQLHNHQATVEVLVVVFQPLAWTLHQTG